MGGRGRRDSVTMTLIFSQMVLMWSGFFGRGLQEMLKNSSVAGVLIALDMGMLL